uniref:Mla1, putative n=1 Tax=Oryza sativa subsp. japonica TaxID=39947 RepID=Q2R1W9_ORYSJ|nr:Mla1, putative [Oryza sativa Japonica Group]
MMCLCVYGETRVPVGIGNFRSLQELDLGMGTIESYENFGMDFGMEVGKLTELRMLNIKGIDEGKWKALIQSVFMLPRIQKLEISFFSLGKMITWDGWDHWEPSRQLQQLSINGICLPRLPVWMNSICIPHLSCMDLKVSTIEASDLDVIARLPALCEVVLQFIWTDIESWTMMLRTNLNYRPYALFRSFVLVARTATAAAAPEPSHADGVEDSGGGGCKFQALLSRMGSRIVMATVAPEPSLMDGVEDGCCRASCHRRLRRRWLPSLPPRIGPTIAATTMAPEAFAEVVDDGGSDGGG